MKAHICIGGALDGQFATSVDFEDGRHHWEWPEGRGVGKPVKIYDGPAGMYHHLADHYYAYNSASGGRGTARNKPSMVWLHIDLLKPSISPKDR
jgi:hypothetical protein